MAKRGLSIEIGVQQTKVCEIDFRKKHPKVYKTHIFHTPDNTIEDGYIRDKATFAVILKQELEKAGLYNKKNRDVIYTIASTTIANREITIPLVKDKQIPEIVKAAAQDYFPIDISEYTITYSVLEKQTQGEEKNIRLLLLAAPDSLIKNYYSFSEDMGFRVEAIDYVGNSSMQLLKRQVGEGSGVTVQINEQTTLINIIENGSIAMQRTVAYGMQASVEAIIDNPVFEKYTEREAGDYLLAEPVILPSFQYEEAEAEAAAALEENPDAGRVLRAREEVTESLGYHINNVQRLLDYYHSKNPDHVIETIYLTGIGAGIKGISELFQTELGIKTVQLKELPGVDFSGNVQEIMNNQTEFMSVIGAAIAPLNFVLKEAEAKQNKKDQMRSARRILVLSTVAAVVIAGSSIFQYKMEDLANRELKQRVANLEPIEQVYNENVEVNTYYFEVSGMYSMTKTGNESFRQLIDELEKKLPTNMLVTSISGTEQGITMNLETTTKISVAKLLMNLNEIELLTDVTVPAVSSSMAEGQVEKYVFSVTAKYSEAALEDGLIVPVDPDIIGAPAQGEAEETEETPVDGE